MLTEEEKKLIKEAGVELCRTAELAKGFHENAKWLTQHYRTLVAELEDEVMALKADVYQLETLNSELGQSKSSLQTELNVSIVELQDLRRKNANDRLTIAELKNAMMHCEETRNQSDASVKFWGSLFGVSVCVSFFLLMLLLKGVCG